VAGLSPIFVGGHGFAALTAFENWPEPGPPVIKGVRAEAGEPPPQTPTAALGSVGIQPFSSPSE